MDFCKCLWSAIRWHRCFFQVNELTTGGAVMTLAKSSPPAPAAPLDNALLLVRFHSEWEMEVCPVDYFTEMQSVPGFCLTTVTTCLNEYRCQRWMSWLLLMEIVWLILFWLPEIKRNHMLGVSIPWLIFYLCRWYSVKQVSNVNDFRQSL